MKVNLTTFEELHRPMYVLEERLLRRNLELIRSVAHDSGAEIILAFKAYVLWKTFPLIRQYVGAATASSLYEARLAAEEFGRNLYTVRVSDNFFVGSAQKTQTGTKGPDTTMRLFNQL